MRKGYSALAVVGIAAAIATIGFVTMPENGSNFLQVTDDKQFLEFVSKYGKSYSSQGEYKFRAEVFKRALKTIAERNSRNGITYQVGVNKFADWTKEEYRQLLSYKKVRVSSNGDEQQTEFRTFKFNDLPKSVDWRDKNAVNDIQDQGQCGSCWAFSSVAAIEGHHAIKTGKLAKLSEQQLVDCAGGVYGNEGCDGGDMTAAMNYTMTYPLMNEDDYPYAEYDQKCQYAATKGQVAVTAIHPVAPNDPLQLLAAVAQGPVSVAIEADSDDFQYYQWGIMNGAMCGTDLDHGVTVVGYDISDGIYDGWYIVRNSWGDQWGESGYFRVAINKDLPEGVCGIQMQPVWPETN